MTFRSSRLLARLGAATLVAGALAVNAAPVSAAEGVDLTVTLSGGKIASGVPSAVVLAKVRNLGDARAGGVEFEVDASRIDPGKISEVTAQPFDGITCENVGSKFTCALDGTLTKGETREIGIALSVAAGAATGAAGSFSVAVRNEQEPQGDNNAALLEVELVEADGPDLAAVALDVTTGSEGGAVKPVLPGRTAALNWALANQGSRLITGLAFTIELPEHVSFVEKFEGCTYTDGDRIASCDLPELPHPLQFDDSIGSTDEAPWNVKVADDAPGPLTPVGTITGRATATQEVSDLRALTRIGSASNKGPAWVRVQDAPEDIDDSDNSDDFTVFIGARTGGGGGLPVTGANAAVIGGIGIGVTVLGTVLFIGARRRRVVLLTPAE